MSGKIHDHEGGCARSRLEVQGSRILKPILLILVIVVQTKNGPTQAGQDRIRASGPRARGETAISPLAGTHDRTGMETVATSRRVP
jgi:hypothetical protein